ncbi:MAG: MFS transporter [Candidatus Lokiarchaeota archaeon]|nr:MFS transporter [Candidatus Lokiarchaeota archaeon]MBD3198473.1 MFS transporter [Candidatus Lokiarchaeota archaeon]
MDIKANDKMIKQNETEEKYSMGKFFSYSSAWFMDTFFLVYFGQVVVYYYEKVVLLDIIWLAIAYSIFSIWNAFNDPLLAFFTEKPRTWTRKYGLRTLWIISAAFLGSITFVLIFFPPNVDAVANPIPIFIYFVIIVCLYDAFYTIFNSNYTGASVTIFKTNKQRRKIAGSALIFSTLGSFTASALIIPTFIEKSNPESYSFAAIIVLIILLINSFIIIPGMKEPEFLTNRYIIAYEKAKKEDVSFKKVLKVALKKKNFLMYLIAYLFFSIAYNLNYNSSLYFITDVLQESISINMIAQLGFILGFILFMPIWLKIAKRIGHAKSFGIGYILLGIAYLPFMWATTVIEYIIYYTIGGIFYAASASILVAIIADTYDEVVVALGRHHEATLQGITNFFFRFSYLIAIGIIAVIHIFTGFDAKASYQVGAAAIGVRIHTGLIGGILCIIAGIMFLLVYDMKGKKKRKIQEKLKELEK